MKTLILNFKNYKEILGNGSLRLSMAAEKVSRKTGVDIIIAPPTPFLAHIASHVKIPVFAQSLSEGREGQSTGATIAAAAKAAGASGSILNHSEARLRPASLRKVADSARENGLSMCVCARNSLEAEAACSLEPEYMALEPPELIGTGRAVSKENPRLVSNALGLVRDLGFHGRFICGAGISSASDVRAAVKLGAEGVMLSSSVIKTSNWSAKLKELVEALGD